MPGDSQPSSGFASEGSPAVTRKLCRSRSASSDFRKARFKFSRDLTHDSANSTSLLLKGFSFSTGDEGTTSLFPAITCTAPTSAHINKKRLPVIIYIVS